MRNTLHQSVVGAIGHSPDAHSDDFGPGKFWDGEGDYLIAPTTTCRAALGDLRWLLAGTEQVLLLMLEDAREGDLYLYSLLLQQVQMGRNLVREAERLQDLQDCVPQQVAA
ncbi:hypothetical protein I5U65_07520 [Stenotrophomonas maltophilia]|nr:hypothetical protein [Stenotrophomonas maltophilia]